MTITFVGHGYVGLVTACVFADFGNKVWVIGHTPEKIDRLKKGDPLIYEPGLKELLVKNLKAKRLHFTLDFAQAIPESDIVFITVGTPTDKDGAADLKAVFDVVQKIAPRLKKGTTVVSCKSTVPVGTNKKVEQLINQYKPKEARVLIASCPEFLREGTAVADTFHPDRVVIGSDSPEALKLLLQLHQPLKSEPVVTDLASAELIKYAANSMLATKVSFANFIALYCEKTGADVETVLDAVGLDKRIGRVFLNPGVGYGGSCLPKDVAALIHTGKALGLDASFLEAVDTVNNLAKDNFYRKIVEHSPGKHLAAWGLSFKPETDDIRYSPALYVIEKLLKQGFSITAYDPAAMGNVKKVLGDKIKYASGPYEALKGADALCIFTEWNEFKEIDLKKVRKELKKAVIFDGRNIYQPEALKKIGFTYFGVGRSL